MLTEKSGATSPLAAMTGLELTGAVEPVEVSLQAARSKVVMRMAEPESSRHRDLFISSSPAG